MTEHPRVPRLLVADHDVTIARYTQAPGLAWIADPDTGNDKR
ncbi:MAG: hypothetical protein ABIU96_08760 [Rhodanobacter sp.]